MLGAIIGDIVGSRFELNSTNDYNFDIIISVGYRGSLGLFSPFFEKIRKKRHTNMAKDLTTTNGLLQTEDSEYVRLVSLISDVWDKVKGNAALAVNTELLYASWETGRYIVEYEQRGNVKAEYGKQLLTNLSKDLTMLRGKGYSRSNLINMRLFYVRFPKIQTCLDN